MPCHFSTPPPAAPLAPAFPTAWAVWAYSVALLIFRRHWRCGPCPGFGARRCAIRPASFLCLCMFLLLSLLRRASSCAVGPSIPELPNPHSLSANAVPHRYWPRVSPSFRAVPQHWANDLRKLAQAPRKHGASPEFDMKEYLSGLIYGRPDFLVSANSRNTGLSSGYPRFQA